MQHLHYLPSPAALQQFFFRPFLFSASKRIDLLCSTAAAVVWAAETLEIFFPMSSLVMEVVVSPAELRFPE